MASWLAASQLLGRDFIGGETVAWRDNCKPMYTPLPCPLMKDFEIVLALRKMLFSPSNALKKFSDEHKLYPFRKFALQV